MMEMDDERKGWGECERRRRRREEGGRRDEEWEMDTTIDSRRNQPDLVRFS